jgi:predicted helicase
MDEIHANEIILLAYYIAAINIEATFHEVYGGEYVPFQGIVLADTFQMSETRNIEDEIFRQNNTRIIKQKNIDIRVILGNPPYSIGQKSENDGNKNLRYPVLDRKIRDTYVYKSKVVAKNSLYDSYVRAFRWATDRIRDKGIICFVSNGSYIDSASADGFRKSLVEDFSSIYCFNLRGNARTSGEDRIKEKGNVFGSGSRTPVAITLLVKNPSNLDPCKIYYYDIGDYLTQKQKLEIIKSTKDISGLQWQMILPDKSGDWINHRDPLFESFTPIGDKKDKQNLAIFEVYSSGIKTNRDAWAYNFSKMRLLEYMKSTIDFYNTQVNEFDSLIESGKVSINSKFSASKVVEGFIDRNPKAISWDSTLKDDLRKRKGSNFNEKNAVVSMYRPYCKEWFYYDGQWNNSIHLMPQIFPTPNHRNFVISTSGVGASKPFSALITEVIPDLQLQFNGQCFPLYKYVKIDDEGKLFDSDNVIDGYKKEYSIVDQALFIYQKNYSNEKITKDDIFYYIYGLLHSPYYRQKFSSDLKKTLPRIPMVENFYGFVEAGRKLADIHINYEIIKPYPLEGLPSKNSKSSDFKVVKMKFAKIGPKEDRSKIIFNSKVALENIPEQAYHYQVNGKSAIEWVIERYQVKTDKDSGILNDPNNWSDDPCYIVNLVARIVKVSIDTIEIIQNLPSFEIS